MDETTINFVEVTENVCCVNNDEQISNCCQIRDVKNVVKCNGVHSLEELVRKGLDLHIKLQAGNTLLHYAAFYGRSEIVRYLCEHGLNVNRANKNHMTALHFASMHGSIDIVKYICELGADVNAKNGRNFTALHFSVKNKHFECVKYLFEKSAKLDERTSSGMAALHYAIRNRDFKISKYLFEKGASVHVKDKTGFSPFDYAIKDANFGIVRYMCDKGLDVNVKTTNGWTILHHAVKKGNLNLVKYFIEKGGCVDEPDDDGYTALHYAMTKYWRFKIFKEIYHSQLNIDSSNYTQWIPFEIFDDVHNYTKIQLTQQSKNKRSKLFRRLFNELMFYNDCAYGNVINGNMTRVSYINQLLNEDFDTRFMCTFDQSAPHLLTCTKRLNCGHNVCLRCVLRIHFDYDSVVCLTDHCFKEYNINLDSLLKLSTACFVKTFSDDELKAVSTKSVDVLNKSIHFIQQEKLNTVNELYQSFLNKLSYPEDIIEVQIESLKMQMDDLKMELKKRVSKYKRILKKKHYNYPSYCDSIPYLINALKNFSTSTNPVKKDNVGMLKVQCIFMNIESYTWKVVNNIEKSIYFNDVNNVEMMNKLKEVKKKRDINEDVRCIRFLKQSDNILAKLTHNYKDYKKLQTLFKSKSRLRKSVEDVVHLNMKRKHFSIDCFLKRIEELKNAENMNDFIDKVNSIQIDWHPTKNELKAFNLVRNGLLCELKELFECDTSMRIDICHNHSTLLLEAVYWEKYEIVEYLIKKGANFCVTDATGRNALQLAALNNQNNKIINLLIEHNCPFPNDELKAILLNDTEVLKIIDLDMHDSSGATPLHYIAARGDVNMLGLLKDLHNADYHLKDKKGFTSISRASSNGRLNMVQELIRIFNIKLDYSSDIVKSILHTSLLFSDNTDVLKWWFESVSSIPNDVIDRNSLVVWIGGKNSETLVKKIDFLISKGADLTVKDEFGCNLLMICAENTYKRPNNEDLLKHIVANGLNLEDRNKMHQTIFHIAAKNGDLKLLKIISGGLSTNVYHLTDSNGYKPIEYAIENGHVDTSNWLLTNKYYDGSYTDNYVNILDVAMENGYEELSRLIEKCGLKSRIAQYFKSAFETVSTNEDGFEFHAHNLAKIGSKQVIKLNNLGEHIIKFFNHCNLKTVIKHEIPIKNYLDNAGATALHLASAFGRNDIILWLYRNKFPMKVTDKLGYTSLIYAAFNGHISTVLLLNALGIEDLHKCGIEPLLNQFRLSKLNKRMFDLSLLLEELAVAIELLHYTSNLLEQQEVKQKIKSTFESVLLKIT